MRFSQVLILLLALSLPFASLAADVETGVPPEIAPSDTLPPAPVLDLSAADYVDNSDAGDRITLSWTLSADDGAGAGDVTGYHVWRSTSASARGDTLESVAAGVSSFMDDAAEPGTPYYYRVAVETDR